MALCNCAGHAVRQRDVRSVLCLQGLQFLPDCTAGLAEIRRVMKPGARLVAIVWNAIESCEGQYEDSEGVTLPVGYLVLVARADTVHRPCAIDHGITTSIK